MNLSASLSRNVGKLLWAPTLMHGYLRLLIPGEIQMVQDEFAGCAVVELVD